MQYSEKSANGDAGEFYFAYQIASVLKWPCRLLDIDIGIDAQVEILRKDQSGTGQFVAFQIKAISKEEKSCRYVSQRQLDYWRELSLPVFVVLVDLSSTRMYLHQVLLDKDYPLTPKGAVRIDFDLDNDLFTATSGERLAAAASEAGLAHIKTHLNEVKRGLNRIRHEIARTKSYGNPRDLIACMEKRYALRESMSQAEAVSDALGVGEELCNEASQELADTLQNLRNHMRDCSMLEDWDSDGEIAKFIAEG